MQRVVRKLLIQSLGQITNDRGPYGYNYQHVDLLVESVNFKRTRTDVDTWLLRQQYVTNFGLSPRT